MTPASVILLLVGIISTNIIWGYPWIGIFSACISLFVVGFVLNRWSLPSLESDFQLPRTAVAGTPFQSRAILTNHSRIPAMELKIAMASADRDHKTSIFQSQLAGGIVEMIRPGERLGQNVTLLCQKRGIHQLPDLYVTTWFPFHLFRYTRLVETIASIPVTPKLLSANDGAIAGGLLDALGTWTRNLLSGDAMDYTGSREYEPGMPVRRWDFSSWARLGQPIIREYQSPSVRTITLIVDTAIDPSSSGDRQLADQRLESVLSLAATVIEHVSRHPIQIRLVVTGQDWDLQVGGAFDRESLLIRLAAASRESEQAANRSIVEWCDHLSNSPALIMTSRSQPSGDQQLPACVSILNVQTADLSHGVRHHAATKQETVQTR
ncbi:MAG: DUF58 domain-containing protein [Pirellulaceae bacterium]|nr:DUF58 domain-containing protein [Pirellulaceae bacterium]